MESLKGLKDKDQDLISLTNLNYEAWAPKCVDRLLAYPGPWEWIKNGVKSAFITPPLEVLREQQQQRRLAPAAGRGRRDGVGRGAGGTQARERQLARGMAVLAQEEDEDQEVARGGQAVQDEAQMMRNPLFPGEEEEKFGKNCCAPTA